MVGKVDRKRLRENRVRTGESEPESIVLNTSFWYIQPACIYFDWLILTFYVDHSALRAQS